MRRILYPFIALATLSAAGFVTTTSFAADASPTTAQLNSLNTTISQKQAQLEELTKKIQSYQQQIDLNERASASLKDELATLDNRITKGQLDIDATNLQISTANDEVHALDLQIQQANADLANQKTMLAAVLRQMQQTDDVNAVELIFGNASFSELFNALSHLESVNSDLGSILEQTKATEAQVESKRSDKQAKLDNLNALSAQLATQQSQLEDQSGAKETLLSATQQSESNYQALVNQLRQESDSIGQQVAAMQNQVQGKLDSHGSTDNTSLLSWPLSHYVITTLFHDPTYPFRYLFQHPGVDLATPVGSSVMSAASGYVAFAKVGVDYGNYVMIIHGNGIATLYAHLSKVEVTADQYVTRGEEIGKSGGMPGMQGAGLSTGPHLHFEVRLNGIPVDPLGYLTR